MAQTKTKAELKSKAAKTFYLPPGHDADWDKARRIAEIRGESISSVLLERLLAYVKENEALYASVESATKGKGKSK